jgi:hypothetical protein
MAEIAISTGQAPHYTELATGLGLAMEEGKQLLYDERGPPAASSWSSGVTYQQTQNPEGPAT